MISLARMEAFFAVGMGAGQEFIDFLIYSPSVRGPGIR
jgi:hypothetical protein